MGEISVRSDRSIRGVHFFVFVFVFVFVLFYLLLSLSFLPTPGVLKLVLLQQVQPSRHGAHRHDALDRCHGGVRPEDIPRARLALREGYAVRACEPKPKRALPCAKSAAPLQLTPDSQLHHELRPTIYTI